MTNTLTLTARQFASLVKPVMPLADRTGMLPDLNAVRITTSGDYAKAEATDRMRLGITRVGLEQQPDPDFDVLIPLDSVKQILAMFKPTRSTDPELKFETGKDTVTVSQEGGFFSAAQVSFYTRPVDGFPKLARILAKFAVEPVEKVMLNARLLADFQAAVTLGEPLAIRFQGSHSATVVTAGEDFIGAIMPMKSVGKAESEDHFSAWLDFLGRPVAEAVSA